ncbi:MAG: hypothetical protein EBZ03_12645 [Betaproteobacteria bacterium]|nr:hypothetical protein [Betaproteobacteria bacterium]NDH30857.1 hypothetical protein [Betaproteobacteria bacterium]
MLTKAADVRKRRLICSIFSLLFAIETVTAAQTPDWSLLGINGQNKLYIDQRSVKRDGQVVRAETLLNREQGDWMGARSVVGVLELQCEHWKWRTANYKAYADTYASGALLLELPITRHWSAIEHGSEKDLIAKKLCLSEKPTQSAP